MSNTKRIPKLRFPEFKNDEEWNTDSLVELKAIILLEDVHLAQPINFGAERLQYHRVFNKKLKF